ncbi:MAG TPA: hypothetical protein DD415_02995 [Clostridiales bacterium]|nr:hypothetical protein [Clostridiales bacterium]
MIKKFFSQRKLNILYSSAAILLMWLIWVAAYYAAGNPLVVPSFPETASSFFKYLADGEFWLAVCNSFLRTIAAFLVSFALALIFAVLSVLSRFAKVFLKPFIVFVRTLPTMAVMLIIFKITLGNRAVSPVIVTVLVLFPLTYEGLMSAFGAYSEELKEMSEVYNISVKDRLFKIYLPLAAPQVLSRTGADISLGLKVMISAEVLVSTAKGLGGMMQLQSIAGEVANLAALTLAAVVLGLIIDVIFSCIEKYAFGWRHKEVTGFGN